jgi:CBS domain containing-hemolysin-like protein
MELVTWILLIFFVTQSAMFSGLTIGLFGLSRLGLETEAESGNIDAKKVLDIRRDSNYLLTTLLWGNVAVNVLIALLTDSIMGGTAAFIFSTIIITCFGEIMPQAYFTRKALKAGAYLVPIVRIYQLIFYPFAKPSAIMLDWWLGKEEIMFFRERSLKKVLQRHIQSATSDIGSVEGQGALNFLTMDDTKITKEGNPIDPKSIISLPTKNRKPVFPEFKQTLEDPFLKKIGESGKKWVIITDPEGNPIRTLNSDDLLRDLAYGNTTIDPEDYCHRPVIVMSPKTRLEEVIPKLRVYPENDKGEIIDQDVIIYWTDDEKRIMTGSDILARLLRGVVRRVETTF